jgi:acyl carrier protein phosphodiesterase
VNWLAHLFLSEPDTEFRLGNLLADCVRRPDRPNMPPNFQCGIRQHQRIDAFTDTHEIVRRSRARLTGDYRHTRGILVDIFYDHFLALHWPRYCPQPLESFTSDFYSAIRTCPIDLPADAQGAVDYIVSDDRLASYRTIDGIDLALRRLSGRLSTRFNRHFALEKATAELIDNFAGLETDFGEFFPALRSHLDTIRES